MFAILLSLLPALAAPPAKAPVLAQEGQSQTQPARVKKGVTAQIRPFFDRKTPMLLELPEGSLVEVVRQNVPWSEVRVPGGLEVWVHGDYVNWKDGKVHAKTSRLRARPLPSTSGSAHPVGKLSTEWALPVLDQKEAWLKVLAPEELSAWVLTEQIEIHNQPPIAWAASWKSAGEKRAQAVMASAKPVEARGDEPQPAEGKAKPATEGEKPIAAEAGTEAQPSEGAAKLAEGAAVAEEAAAPKSALIGKAVGLELLKKDPALAVATARKNLDAHASEVTDTLDFFAPQVLENCEMIFSAVLLKSKDVVLLADARQGLTRSDALRKFHTSAITARLRRAEVEQGLAAGALTKKDEVKGPLGGEGQATWVGHLVHRPHQYPDTPFAAVRGDREVLVHSFDGRFYLRDYLGREVVVRGTWRKSGKDGKQRVVSIEEIRVLPRTPRPE